MSSDAHPSAPPPSGSQPRVLLLTVCVAACFITLNGFTQLKDYLGPLLFALNLVIVAYPIQQWLNRLGAPRPVGVMASMVVVSLILGAFFWSLIWSLGAFVEEVPKYQNQFMDMYHSLIDRLTRFGISETSISNAVRDQLSPNQVATVTTGVLQSASNIITPMIFTVTILFMVIIDSVTYPQRMQRVMEARPTLAASLSHFCRGVRRYWVVSSIFGLIVAAIDVAFLWALGVPLAMVWGVLSFLTNYIPNIGFVLGLIPPALMALLANDVMTAVWVVVLYSVANFVVQSLIQPKFTGDAVGVTATVSMLSLLVWTYALGALGALLALPATLLVKALLIDADPSMRWLNAFIADKPEKAQADAELV